jgi:hypothetical protein
MITVYSLTVPVYQLGVHKAVMTGNMLMCAGLPSK